MEEMLELGGYFKAVEAGFFVDSGEYPERGGDGIAREIEGGIGAGTVYPRDPDYMAPVTAHFGYNNLKQYGPEAEADPSSLIGGCTFEKPEKIVYIDELDEEDNVNVRLENTRELRKSTKILPEMEWAGDGIVQTTMFLPADRKTAYHTAIEIGRKMGLKDVEVIHTEVMHPSEGTRVEIKGRFDTAVDVFALDIPLNRISLQRRR